MGTQLNTTQNDPCGKLENKDVVNRNKYFLRQIKVGHMSIVVISGGENHRGSLDAPSQLHLTK